MKPSQKIGFQRPPLRVGRLDNACHTCRIKRQKCDMATPACSTCEKLGVPCVTGSSQESGILGEELRYHVFLEKKVLEVEKTLRQECENLGIDIIDRAIEKDDCGSLITEDVEKDEIGYVSDDGSKNIHLSKSHKVDENGNKHHGRAMVKEAGSSSPIDSYLVHHDNIGGLSLMQLVLLASGATMADFNLFGVVREKSVLKTMLPSRQVADTLVEHYLTCSWQILPVCSPELIYNQLEKIYSSEMNSIYDYFIVFIIMAIATASLTHEKGSIGVRGSLKFYRVALWISAEINLKTILGLQAVIFLLLYAMLNPNALNSWLLLSAAMRTCTSIDLHKEPLLNSDDDTQSLEVRKRLFWIVYYLDRMYSMSVGQWFDFSENIISVSYPSQYYILNNTINFTEFSASTSNKISASGFLLSLKLRRIQARAYSLATASNSDPDLRLLLRSDLKEYKNSILSSRFTGNTNEILMLEYSYALVLLLRPTACTVFKSMVDVQNIVDACLLYNGKFKSSRILHQTIYPFLTALQIYSVGITLISSLWYNMDFLQNGILPLVLSSLNETTSFLSELLSRWSGESDILKTYESVVHSFIFHITESNISCPAVIISFPASLKQSIPNLHKIDDSQKYDELLSTILI